MMYDVRTPKILITLNIEYQTLNILLLTTAISYREVRKVARGHRILNLKHWTSPSCQLPNLEPRILNISPTYISYPFQNLTQIHHKVTLKDTDFVSHSSTFAPWLLIRPYLIHRVARRWEWNGCLFYRTSNKVFIKYPAIRQQFAGDRNNPLQTLMSRPENYPEQSADDLIYF